MRGLTYFVELGAGPLRRLFERPGLLERLAATRAAISMAMLDLSEERRGLVEELGRRGVPVTAWLVLPAEQGYWLTADNAQLAHARYREVRAWALRNELRFEAVGLDLEPPHEDVRALLEQGRRALTRLVLARRSRRALERAQRQYQLLIDEARGDGYRVETYQFPLILDERRAGSTLLQRSLGFVDLRPDREVLMLYESLLPPRLSDAMVDTYGPECQAIGLGITGGGVELVLRAFGHRRLDLPRLLLGLRRARRYTQHRYVFSLEGCVEAGNFEALTEADLTLPAPCAELARGGAALRAGLQLLLRTEGIWDRVQHG